MGRGRKLTIVLVVVLVTVTGLLVIGDRVAAYAAEQTIAKQAKQELAAREITTPQEPTVDVSGFPFLTQVASGKYDKITITVVKPASKGVTLDSLRVVATGVYAPAGTLIKGNGRVTADLVTGTAALNWDNVVKLIDVSGYGGTGATVSALPDGQVRVKVPVTALGISTTLVATGTVTVADGKAQVTIKQVATEGGTIPAVFNQLLGQFKQALSVQVAIPPLPYHLQVRSAQARPEGLVITAEAKNVPIAGQATG